MCILILISFFIVFSHTSLDGLHLVYLIFLSILNYGMKKYLPLCHINFIVKELKIEVPKKILFVPEIIKATNGKADYKWANEKSKKELN